MSAREIPGRYQGGQALNRGTYCARAPPFLREAWRSQASTLQGTDAFVFTGW